MSGIPEPDEDREWTHDGYHGDEAALDPAIDEYERKFREEYARTGRPAYWPYGWGSYDRARARDAERALMKYDEMDEFLRSHRRWE